MTCFGIKEGYEWEHRRMGDGGRRQGEEIESLDLTLVSV